MSDRLLFGSPVTGLIEIGANVWGGRWYVTVNFCDFYTATGKPAYHPGCDLNLPNYADSGKPVYACADGVVIIAAMVRGWSGQMVIIMHTLEDGTHIWSRCAHVNATAQLGPVKRGDVIGTIGDYPPTGPQNDHLDFSLCRDDLGAKPGDWPGLNITRIRNRYISPEKWLRERGK